MMLADGGHPHSFGSRPMPSSDTPSREHIHNMYEKIASLVPTYYVGPMEATFLKTFLDLHYSLLYCVVEASMLSKRFPNTLLAALGA